MATKATARTGKGTTVKAASVTTEQKSKFVEQAQKVTTTDQNDVRGGYAVTHDTERNLLLITIPLSEAEAPLLKAGKTTSTGKVYVAQNHRGNEQLGIDPKQHKTHILRVNGRQYGLGLYVTLDPNYKEVVPEQKPAADDARVKELEAKLAEQAKRIEEQNARMERLLALMERSAATPQAAAPTTDAAEAIAAD